jgi:predicted ABC-type transport system involved in lysophospholipase L1 biosynthesis ATPase subunit
MMNKPLAPALELKNVSRSYPEAGGRLDVFTNVSLAVAAGEIVALVGPSGAGKSSLLHIAGLLERPTAGQAFIAGRNCSDLDDAGQNTGSSHRHWLHLSVPPSPGRVRRPGECHDPATHRQC